MKCDCPDFTGPVDTRHVCPVHGPLYADDEDAAYKSQAPDHPEWALAYILTDWKRNRVVSKAYKAVCDESEDAPALIAEALRKCRVYVAALEEVVPNV